MRYLLIFFISLINAQSLEKLLEDNYSFQADITIEQNNLIQSSAKITFTRGNYIISEIMPINQTIAIINESIFIQDDDFKQVISRKNHRKLIFNVLSDYSKFTLARCDELCYCSNQYDDYANLCIKFSDSRISKISFTDVNQIENLISFNNFIKGDFNISYNPPKTYNFIADD
tara:strand:- start:769 stop:1287 length:519 start_codon:yes stop_codon:yes gene_type:complete